MNKASVGLFFAIVSVSCSPVSANLLNKFKEGLEDAQDRINNTLSEGSSEERLSDSSQPQEEDSPELPSFEEVGKNRTEPVAYRGTRFGDTPAEAVTHLYKDLGQYAEFDITDFKNGQLPNGRVVERVSNPDISHYGYEFSVINVLKEALKDLDLVDPEKFDFADFERYLRDGYASGRIGLDEYLSPYISGSLQYGPRVLFSTEAEYSVLEQPFGKINLIFSVNELAFASGSGALIETADPRTMTGLVAYDDRNALGPVAILTNGDQFISFDDPNFPSGDKFIVYDYALQPRGVEWFGRNSYDEQQELQGLLMVYVSFWRALGVVTPSQVVDGFIEKYPESIVETEETVFEVDLPASLPGTRLMTPQVKASIRMDIVTIKHFGEGRYIYLKNYDLDSMRLSLDFDLATLNERDPSITSERFAEIQQVLAQDIRLTLEDPRVTYNNHHTQGAGTPHGQGVFLSESPRGSDLYHMPYIIYLGSDMLEGIVNEYYAFREWQENEIQLEKDSQAEGALEF